MANPVWSNVLVVITLSLGFLLYRGWASLSLSLKMLWRLKWLYLSIFITFGWFTPGEALVSSQAISTAYLPTTEGLLAGALRVTVLIAIVSMVAGMLQTVEKDKLVSAILWLTMPLKVIGLDSQRFALLLVLTLDKVLTYKTVMRKRPDNNQPGTGLLNAASMMIARYLDTIENVAGHEQVLDIQLDETNSPPLWQWLLPLMLAVVLYQLSY